MNEPKQIQITDLINPVFYTFWRNAKSNAVLKGGRGSMKSSVVSLKLVTDFINDPQCNVIVLRKVARYLSGSVYNQIEWAIDKLGLRNQFFFGKSPLVIKHKKRGTAFYFYGVDDPMKLKGIKIPIGYVKSIWFEELAEFDGVEDIDIVTDTFIRQDLGGEEVKMYYSYNPPRSQWSWVNTWTDSKKNDPDYFIHHSTYLDDEKGFLSGQQLRKIAQYKKTDPDYHNWMYLGKIVGLGNMVYNINQFHLIDELPEDDDIILIDIAIDTGHQVSATVFCAFALTKKQNVILLDTYYYSPANKVVKKAPSQLTDDYWNWRSEIQQKYRKPIDTETIDSAEGGMRNEIYLKYHLNIRPVAKMKNIDMIDSVQSLLSQGRFFILDTPNNKIFYEEHKKYQWDQDTLQSPEPKVVKIDDHTIDSMKYFVISNRKKLNLMF